LLQRGDQRFLRKILGQADIANYAGECRNNFRRLDSPDRINDAVDVSYRHFKDDNMSERKKARRVVGHNPERR
jgi:hypothetical protein